MQCITFGLTMGVPVVLLCLVCIAITFPVEISVNHDAIYEKAKDITRKTVLITFKIDILSSTLIYSFAKFCVTFLIRNLHFKNTEL